jgi:periplasmic protein TonB
VLRTLFESNARRPRRRAGLVASIAIHTILIGGALAATAAANARPGREPIAPPPTIIYTPRDITPASNSPSRKASRRPTVLQPTRVPPDVGRTVSYFPDSVLRRMVDIDGEWLLPIDTALASCLIRCQAGSAGDSIDAPGRGGMPATRATVDRAAVIVSTPRPRYPEQLRAAGVTGRVLVRLVVDTLGRVEPASVVLRESSHDLFARAVLVTLSGLRFIPAESGGRRVRMLVDLPFEFRLNE